MNAQREINMLAIRQEDLQCLPIFPLPELVFFPHTAVPLHIFEARYRKMISDVLSGGLPLAVVMTKDRLLMSERPAVHSVAGVGRVVEHRQLQDGRYYVLLAGLGRIRIVEELATTQPYRLVSAQLLEDSVSEELAQHPDTALTPLKGFVFSLARKRPPIAAMLAELLKSSHDPSTITDVLSATLIQDVLERQKLLETLDVDSRLNTVTAAVAALVAERIQENGGSELLN